MSNFSGNAATVVLAAYFLVGCGALMAVHSSEKRPIGLEVSQVKKKATLDVVVSEFKRDAMHDDFMDGTSESYDLMVLEVIEPVRYKGVELQIANEANSDVKPAQMEVGKRYVIEVEEVVVDAATKAGKSMRGTSTSELYISPDQVEIVSASSD